MISEPTGWVANCENCWTEISSNCCEECMKAKQEDELEGGAE